MTGSMGGGAAAEVPHGAATAAMGSMYGARGDAMAGAFNAGSSIFGGMNNLSTADKLYLAFQGLKDAGQTVASHGRDPGTSMQSIIADLNQERRFQQSFGLQERALRQERELGYATLGSREAIEGMKAEERAMRSKWIKRIDPNDPSQEQDVRVDRYGQVLEIGGTRPRSSAADRATELTANQIREDREISTKRDFLDSLVASGEDPFSIQTNYPNDWKIARKRRYNDTEEGYRSFLARFSPEIQAAAERAAGGEQGPGFNPWTWAAQGIAEFFAESPAGAAGQVAAQTGAPTTTALPEGLPDEGLEIDEFATSTQPGLFEAGFGLQAPPREEYVTAPASGGALTLPPIEPSVVSGGRPVTYRAPGGGSPGREAISRYFTEANERARRRPPTYMGGRGS